MVVTLDGTVSDASELHELNAAPFITVTPLGIVNFFRLLHPEKQLLEIVVTDGIDTKGNV